MAPNVKGSGVHDDVVYGLAVHYYDEDDIKVNKLMILLLYFLFSALLCRFPTTLRAV